MLNYEEHARYVVADRLRDAERQRLVRRARAQRSSVRVWELGAVVVAWKPRRRAADVTSDTPVVLWL